MLIVLSILIATVVMLVFDVFRIDIVAIISMLALVWSGILEPQEMLSGFSSNAVIAMMAVMIMGRGISRTGIMNRLSRTIVRRFGKNRYSIAGILSFLAGLTSGFIQNIGAAVLFLPSTLDASRRTKIPPSHLVMPVGFAVILGGTLTMVGSGHLILVNDLLQSNGFEPFGLFKVTPIGALLFTAGIGFFYFFGKYVLPTSETKEGIYSSQEKLIEGLRLPSKIWHYSIPKGSPLIGRTTEDSGIWATYNVNILGISDANNVVYAPWREVIFKEGQGLALLGTQENIKKMVSDFNFISEPPIKRFETLSDPEEAGFAEVIIRPRSEAVGQTFREYAMRRKFAVEPLRLFSKDDEMRGDFSNHVITAGDIVIVYGLWEKIRELKDTVDFVVATPIKTETKLKSKTWIASLCFILAITLALSGFSVAIAFLTGALGMVLARVLSIQQAYQAIDWKIVFFIAGLIPLGIAMQKTGTAMFLAEGIMGYASDKHLIILLLIVGLASTFFTLIISNFGAIVVLTPMVIGIAELSGIHPPTLVLMSAVCVSNAFLLPTQQVNALMMSSGNYRNADYLKAGGIMTLLFLIITISFFYFLLF